MRNLRETSLSNRTFGDPTGWKAIERAKSYHRIETYPNANHSMNDRVIFERNLPKGNKNVIDPDKLRAAELHDAINTINDLHRRRLMSKYDSRDAKKDIVKELQTLEEKRKQSPKLSSIKYK